MVIILTNRQDIKKAREKIRRLCDCTPKGIRTPVVAVKGRCPRPLDDGSNQE